ncbi:MAG: ATP-binding protein [Desulfocapsaceae bacterium]|jgi:PAS domain S-box-containing protein|nr:ATP-binding protein [Desulfocapsaceae bacterium]
MNLNEKKQSANDILTANGHSVHAVAGIELFHSIQDPVFIVSPRGVIIDANRAALQAAGKSRSGVVGRGICEIIHGGRWPHIKCPLEEFLLTCTGKNEDTRLPGLGGEYHLTITPLVDPDESIHSILLQARSLTTEESRKAESIRTAQLAAIGELAAGVAHEVNNPINGIINYAQLLLDDAQEDSQQAELLGRIVKEGDRIATIIYNLLSFARENENELREIDLKDVIHSCITLVDHQLKSEGIELELELTETSCTIVGNYMQLQQVILNTINNSRYALNERYPESSVDKRLQIRCGPAESAEGRVIRVVVRDFGTGIPQGILDKLFEPFFTSKPAGKGTGLGLSISYGIVKNHGGTLAVDSILNKYTDMIITIPEA